MPASAGSVCSCFNYIQICAFYKMQINSAILEKTNFMSVISETGLSGTDWHLELTLISIFPGFTVNQDLVGESRTADHSSLYSGLSLLHFPPFLLKIPGFSLVLLVWKILSYTLWNEWYRQKKCNCLLSLDFNIVFFHLSGFCFEPWIILEMIICYRTPTEICGLYCDRGIEEAADKLLKTSAQFHCLKISF